MFGYIAVQPQALTEEAKTRYRSRYCGLCRALRDRAGAAGRLALSNDMTFLSILLSSLYEPKESAGSDSCPLHPLKKTAWTRSACTDYAADMNLLLAYLKCLDNVADEGSRAAALRAKRLEKPAALAEERWKEQSRGVREALEEMWRARGPIYRAAADATVDNDGALKDAVIQAEEAYHEAAGH